MPFQVISRSAIGEMSTLWRNRQNAVFEKEVVDKFVLDMTLMAISNDIEAQLLDKIKYAKYPKDLWVSAGRCYDPDYYFTLEGFGGKRLYIKQLIYRTDALQRLAKEFGEKIKVRPLYQNGVIFLKIEFWPNLLVA